MKTLRSRVAVIGMAMVLLTATAYLVLQMNESHLTRFRYESAIQLYASPNPSERHLALQLLNDIPNAHEAIPLIGRRLKDANSQNRLYAAYSLERMLGPVVALPSDAVRDPDGATRMSNAATADYIRRWQEWFEAHYPNA